MLCSCSVVVANDDAHCNLGFFEIRFLAPASVVQCQGNSVIALKAKHGNPAAVDAVL